jgi:hypothetical protein
MVLLVLKPVGLLLVMDDWGAGEVAEEKAPKSESKSLCAKEVCLGGTAGLASKKLPPLSADVVGFAAEACFALPAGGMKLEKAAGLAGCCVGEENESDPKASPNPPSAELADCAGADDCMPPKAPPLL